MLYHTIYNKTHASTPICKLLLILSSNKLTIIKEEASKEEDRQGVEVKQR